jgi:hypothetical protein
LRRSLVLLTAALGFYACWLQWQLADAIAMTAGGTTSNMRTWSEIQLRIAWLMLVILGFNLASLGWDWLLLQFASRPPFGF